jgi:hypothetical protein
VEALVGVGRWVACLWRKGKLLPLSRAVTRAAFSGQIRSAD